ncbi:hypothetical protein [Calothrix sp. PCC 6303]|uniref:hypothetical protein n=1 Tax=Calothrix sp. PCC 6303 TaxID=1170562 RepID=UPI0030DDA5D2
MTARSVKERVGVDSHSETLRQRREGLTSSISPEYSPPDRLTARKDRQKSGVDDRKRSEKSVVIVR